MRAFASDDDDEIYRLAVHEGRNPAEISRIVFWSRAAVSRRVIFLGANITPKMQREDHKEYIYLYEELGYSIRNIALAHKKSDTHVRNALLANGVQLRSPGGWVAPGHRYEGGRPQQAVRLWQIHKRVEKVAEIMGVTPSTVRKYVNLKGVSVVAHYCKHGHELTPENTYTNHNDRKRRCIICKRRVNREYRRRVRQQERELATSNH